MAWNQQLTRSLTLCVFSVIKIRGSDEDWW